MTPAFTTGPKMNEIKIPRAIPWLHLRWITWQILCGISNKAIRDLLAEDALPCPLNSALDRRRKDLQTPLGFSIRSPFNRETEFFLRVLRLERLALGAEETRRARGVLRTPQVREVVETELLLGASHPAVAGAAWDACGFSLTPESICAFEDLFFSVESFTRAQLQIAVEDRVRVGLLRAVSQESDPATVARALSNDSRVVAAASRMRTNSSAGAGGDSTRTAARQAAVPSPYARARDHGAFRR
jgi:hypothetical protein